MTDPYEDIERNDAEWAVGRWKCMLKGLPENLHAVTAVALENQRIYNEMLFDGPTTCVFKRCSIPIVRRVIGGIDTDRVVISSRITSKFGNYKIIDSKLKWSIYDEDNRLAWESHKYTLDYECDWVGRFSKRISKIINDNFKKIELLAFGFLRRDDSFVMYGSLE